eukprot:g18411.t1
MDSAERARILAQNLQPGQKQTAEAALAGLCAELRSGQVNLLNEYVQMSPQCAELFTLWENQAYRRLLSCARTAKTRHGVAAKVLSEHLQLLYRYLGTERDQLLKVCLRLLAGVSSTSQALSAQLLRSFNFGFDGFGRLSGRRYHVSKKDKGRADVGKVDVRSYFSSFAMSCPVATSEQSAAARSSGFGIPPVASTSTNASQLARENFALVQHRSKIKRILDRDGGQAQSTRAFHVRRKRQIYAMFLYDIFHTILELPFLGLYPIIFVTYALCYFIFALMWWSISENCAIGLSSLLSAFYFSVETQMTIGYGAPKENFDGCPEAVVLLPLQAGSCSELDLIEPDMDMHNGVIFLGLPTEVVHKVDFESPLSPVVPRGTEGYPTEMSVRAYMRKSTYLEILVLVSGVEQTTAASFEARHSYTLDDIFWDRTGVDSCGLVDGQDEALANPVDRGVSTRTHPSILATLDPQVADWTIYQSSIGRAARLEEVFANFTRQRSEGDTFTRQNSYNAGDSP